MGGQLTNSDAAVFSLDAADAVGFPLNVAVVCAFFFSVFIYRRLRRKCSLWNCILEGTLQHFS